MTCIHTNLSHWLDGIIAKGPAVLFVVVLLATACLKLNPDYVDPTDGGSKANGEACAVAEECASGYCDMVCCPKSGPCCKDSSGCGGDTPVCSADYQCVECAVHADCQKTLDGGPAVNSPMGVCTPNHLCTCWTESDAGSCSATEQCPGGRNFVCASDVPGNDHFACLRLCAEDTVVSGMVCENRVTAESGAVRVWAPVTSCTAFNKLDSLCLGDGDCSLYGSPPREDGVCPNGTCTYDCTNDATGLADDAWCPDSHVCGDDVPALCIPR